MAHRDEVVTDDAKTHPDFHTIMSLVAAAVQSMPPLEHTNPAFASGSPLLPLLKPARLLQLPAFRTLGGAVGHGHLLHSFFLGGLLPLRRVEPGVCRHQIRNASHALAVDLDGGSQQLTVARPLLEHFIAGDDLAFGFLHLDHLAELGRLLGFAPADDLRGRLEYTYPFPLRVRLAAQYSPPFLLHHP